MTADRACGCPDYVRRCAHAGEYAVWVTYLEDERTEGRKRGLRLPRRGQRWYTCATCREKWELTYPRPLAAVVGPGIVSAPRCVCRSGIGPNNCSPRAQIAYANHQGGTEAEIAALFRNAVRRMRRLAR